MYWWNIRRLRDQLVQGPLPEPMAFRYVMGNVLLWAISFVPGDTTVNRWGVLAYLCWVLLTGAGTYYCYRMNAAAQGRHFMERYFALSFVVGVRLLPWLFAVLIALAILSPQPLAEPIETTPISIAVTVGFSLLVYWRLGVHMHSLRSPNTEALEQG